ncbi:hypothetical protein [Burkholderia vietnamiensis]|uniref:hypothetical protein n=1 Tax=Burkholderia vietnamiensis TaxID=60552 RepID=UPI0026566411|nr:hypothetical protein [Burkholderia vietnamiensis]MDN8037436.1 hypothetical protein [Burkholderia vietnamiensis]
MTATDLMHVLRECRNAPVFVKGNYARTHAIDVAMAASLGFITTESEYGEFGNRWHLTGKGMECLHAEAKSRSTPKTTRRTRRKH